MTKSNLISVQKIEPGHIMMKTFRLKINNNNNSNNNCLHASIQWHEDFIKKSKERLNRVTSISINNLRTNRKRTKN